ncbi:hypothetical protein [Pedobacter nyackensis]|uniref:Uncharacterized protein n=1 Tax=Pedobacter nyackensis TaxID=475255 RepID=A0A1W2F9V8_9SPHI|nr:hypothetical protein [Pedobacter nyackensis]SMD18664.1 hypothetical protein SAMN04488101_1289 [Pedobacter nyackensis]
MESKPDEKIKEDDIPKTDLGNKRDDDENEREKLSKKNKSL